MNKISKGSCPPYISDLFQEQVLNENAPTLRSLTRYTFITPRPYKEIFKKSITYSGPIIWKSLPFDLQSLDSTDKFHSNFIIMMNKRPTGYGLLTYVKYSHCRYADVMQHFSNPIIATNERTIILGSSWF